MHRTRRSPTAVGSDPVGEAIGADLDVAVQIGPKDRNSRIRRQRGKGFRCWMAILVALPGRDDGNARLNRLDERGRRR